MIEKNETIYKTLLLSEDYDGSDLKFKFDISKATYEMDILQQKLLEFYLRVDINFRRAFQQNYTTEFFQALRDKARLKEPFPLSTIGQVRSGKSSSMISVAVYMNALHGRRFTIDHVCPNAYDYISKLQTFPDTKLNNSTFLVDEEKQAVYGVGSIARKMKMTDVQNIIAIRNISTIMIQPQTWSNEDAFYGLKIFGRCFKTKTVRAMLYNLQEKGTGAVTPVGCVYIPIFTEFLPKYYAEALEHDYLLKKHEWVTNEMRGKGDVLSELKKQRAMEFLRDETFRMMKSKNDRKTYISLKLGSEFTTKEIEEIVNISVLIQKGLIK